MAAPMAMFLHFLWFGTWICSFLFFIMYLKLFLYCTSIQGHKCPFPPKPSFPRFGVELQLQAEQVYQLYSCKPNPQWSYSMVKLLWIYIFRVGALPNRTIPSLHVKRERHWGIRREVWRRPRSNQRLQTLCSTNMEYIDG
jgi:hypothetical protein